LANCHPIARNPTFQPEKHGGLTGHLPLASISGAYRGWTTMSVVLNARAILDTALAEAATAAGVPLFADVGLAQADHAHVIRQQLATCRSSMIPESNLPSRGCPLHGPHSPAPLRLTLPPIDQAWPRRTRA
jgi:hypothetical protein